MPKTTKVMVTYKVGKLPHIDRIIKQDRGVNEPYIADTATSLNGLLEGAWVLGVSQYKKLHRRVNTELSSCTMCFSVFFLVFTDK